MIKIENVSKIYKPNIIALENVDIHIKPKEFVSIVGQSGTGKTTLAKLMIAEERPSRGKITIGGWNITKIRSYEVPYLRRQIGVVFQDFNLLYKKTLYENVAFALEVSGVSSRYIKKIVPNVLKIVGLEDKMRRYPVQVSGGEKQRAAIARALVHRPKVLIADEPTGNLDPVNAQDVINLLLKINELGTTVVLITHNKETLKYLDRRVITLDKGRVISDVAGNSALNRNL